MAINLKHISTNDTNNIKLDKVNYNFDQLVANGGGPRGFQGPAGSEGYQGVTGHQGFQGVEGPQGFQGPQGNNGEGIWKINEGNPVGQTIDTILPIHNDTVTPDAPTLTIGYKTSDPEYDNSYIETDSQFVINRQENVSYNLELKSVNVPNSYTFALRGNSGAAELQMGFSSNPGNVIQSANSFTWSDGQTDLITLDSTSLNVSVDSEFNNLEVNGTLKIKSGNPAANKIAVAADDDGTIEFKSLADIGGVVPVGTIVSIDPDFFTDADKFITSETDVDPNGNILEVRIGAGINQHAGWYLCNGKDWTNGESTYSTPNLNSFSYTIQDDPNGSQDTASQTVDDVSIIGGADIAVDATYDTQRQGYDITSSINTSNTLLYPGSSTPFTIKKLPQVIYLGLENLYWSDQGTQLPLWTFSMWTGTVSVNSSGTISLTDGNSDGASTEDANAPANTNAGTRQITVNVAVIAPSGFSNSGNSVAGQRTVTQPTSYVAPPTTYTLTLTSSGSVPNAAISPNDSDTVNSGSTAIVSVTVIPTSGYRFISVDDIEETGTLNSNIIKTLNSVGNIVYSISKPITSNESYNIPISSNSIGASLIPAANMIKDYTLQVATGDDWSITQGALSTYNGPPNGSHTATFTIEYIGNLLLDHPVSTPVITGSQYSIQNWSRVTGTDSYTGTLSVSDVGSSSGTQSLTLDVTYSESNPQPRLAVSTNSISTIGQSTSSPGGRTDSESLTITVEPGAPWTISGLPAWVSASASSGTGSSTVTITTASPGSLNSDRSGSFAVNAGGGAWQSESETISITQDNTFFSAQGMNNINIGPEGDSVFYDVMSNRGFTTFSGGIGQFLPDSANPTANGFTAQTTQVEFIIPANNTGSTRTIEVQIRPSDGSSLLSFFVQQPSSSGGTSGGTSSGDGLGSSPSGGSKLDA